MTSDAQEHPRHPRANDAGAVRRGRDAAVERTRMRRLLRGAGCPRELPDFAGFQTRQNTRQRPERREAADDVHELGPDVVAPRRTGRWRTCRRTRARPARRRRSPRHPLIVTTSHAGTSSDTNGSWRPAIALSVMAGMPVTAAERQDRRADGAERDRRGVGDERQAGGVERREAEARSAAPSRWRPACRSPTRLR